MINTVFWFHLRRSDASRQETGQQCTPYQSLTHDHFVWRINVCCLRCHRHNFNQWEENHRWQNFSSITSIGNCRRSNSLSLLTIKLSCVWHTQHKMTKNTSAPQAGRCNQRRRRNMDERYDLVKRTMQPCCLLQHVRKHWHAYRCHSWCDGKRNHDEGHEDMFQIRDDDC